MIKKIKINELEFIVNYYQNISNKFTEYVNRFWDNIDNWEPSTYKIFNTFLNKEHSYIDLGSWIGPTVLYGSQLAKHCYAFEPDMTSYNELKNNIEINYIKNISLSNYLISYIANDNVNFGNKNFSGDSMTSLFFNSNNKVKTRSLIEMLFQYKIFDCNFIKMDIEGSEFLVIPNILIYLKHIKPTLFISFHPQFTNSTELKNIVSLLTDIYEFAYYENLEIIKSAYIPNKIIFSKENIYGN